MNDAASSASRALWPRAGRDRRRHFLARRHRHVLFLAPDDIADIVRAVSETGIIAVGMTFVIITAGIDLSVGALLSLSSVLTATIMTTAGWG